MQSNNSLQKVTLATTILYSIDFKYIRGRNGYFSRNEHIKKNSHSVPKNGSLKYLKQLLTDIKKDIGNIVVMVEGGEGRVGGRVGGGKFNTRIGQSSKTSARKH